MSNRPIEYTEKDFQLDKKDVEADLLDKTITVVEANERMASMNVARKASRDFYGE